MKYAGYKVQLKRNTTGTTYALVGQVLDIDEIGSDRAQIEVTGHGDSWADFLAGVQEGKEYTVRVALDPADSQHTAMQQDYDNNTGTRKYHLEHPDHTQGVEITTVAIGVGRAFPMDGAYEASYSFKIVNPGLTTYTVT